MILVSELRSRIQYKIIIPFLLLTLLVALTGSTMAFLFIIGSSQDRLNNQLAEVARSTADAVVDQESANLAFLREVTFAAANTANGAPAVADALAAKNVAGLEQALTPYVRIANQRGVHLNRLIIFDQTGQSLLNWKIEYDSEGHQTPQNAPTQQLKAISAVQMILAGQQDELGDKQAGILKLDNANYLYTVAPVRRGDQVIGGAIVALQLDTWLREVATRSQAAIVTIHNPTDGAALATTTAPAEGLEALRIQPSTLPLTIDSQNQLQGVFDIIQVNGRDYQAAYAPLQIRGTILGILSVALSTDYVIGPWGDLRIPLIGLTIVLIVMITGLGITIARQITHPLQELVTTAQAVTTGDLNRRSTVASRDEVGVLSESFNSMTDHLLDLIRVVQSEASQRAAVIESIADGVVVCGPEGNVLVVNQALRRLLNLADDQDAPDFYDQIPLFPLDDSVLNFGDTRITDLFQLNERIIRVESRPFQLDDGTLLGNVHVLQDLTDQVVIDRAKTNFIATISHELRTPLTVIGGNTDMLLRNLVGDLNDDQRVLVEAIRNHSSTMTSLINNVIMIASLDSGSFEMEAEPVQLNDVLGKVLWPIRRTATARGLNLNIQLPGELPLVMADIQCLRTIFAQLLDNACRYTTSGEISVQGYVEDNTVRVDISDTGSGIDNELRKSLFTRFTRGQEGINSAERGMGLGLAIVYELLALNDGNIWLEQTSAQGSTFSFTLPIAPQDAQTTSTTTHLAQAS